MKGDTGLGLYLGFVAGTIFAMWITVKAPTAIEVYQGKTALEYKIVDGEVIDSCVVYKNK